MAIQKLIAREKPFISFKNTHNKLICSTLFSTRQSSDVFQRNNKTSFKKTEGPSQQTIDYINKLKKDLEARGQKLERLSQLDLTKIEDIAKGIDIFEGWNSYDLALVGSNFDVLYLQRGCVHQCAHCGSDSVNKVTAMAWENYEAIVNGMAELKERLGFNIFQIQKRDMVYPFIDSDPMLYKAATSVSESNGSQKTVYKNIYDASKLFYNKTGTKFSITSAGWDKRNKNAEQAALNFIQDPNILSNFFYSITPFHRYQEEGRERLKQSYNETDPIKKQKLEKEAYNLMDKYIEMAADNLITLWPLKNLKINLVYDENRKHKYSYKHAEDLMIEIFNRIEDKIKKSGIQLSHDFSFDEAYQLMAEIKVGYFGRAKNIVLDNLKDQFEYTKFETYEKRIKSIISDPQRRETLLQHPFRINTDGSILINVAGNPEWVGDIRAFLVELTGKRLKLPHPQVIKVAKPIAQIPWPSERDLKDFLAIPR